MSARQDFHPRMLRSVPGFMMGAETIRIAEPPRPPAESARLAATAEAGEKAGDLIYNDPAMADIARRARQVAASDASVLISGESGTGKEVIAKYIHRTSPRAKGPLIAVNCAAIPENLLESELFGYERGAFSGALTRRAGKLEAAHGGTILLDEVTEMDMRLQAKLLRAIQEREVDRLGGSRPVPVDIRIISTTNKMIESEVRKGNFREDLYFRLNVVPIVIPSLRRRPGDIPVLARYFMRRYDLPVPQFDGFSERALAVMTAHAWPGNVRELENAVYRAIVTASAREIAARALDLEVRGTAAAEPEAVAARPIGTCAGRPLHQIEREAIVDTLAIAGGNRTKAAQILGISIRCLRNKLHLYAVADTSSPLAAPRPGS